MSQLKGASPLTIYHKRTDRFRPFGKQSVLIGQEMGIIPCCETDALHCLHMSFYVQIQGQFGIYDHDGRQDTNLYRDTHKPLYKKTIHV